MFFAMGHAKPKGEVGPQISGKTGRTCFLTYGRGGFGADKRNAAVGKIAAFGVLL